MTIRTKEEDVPSEFAPARLFLDDIEEIVCIFRQAIQSQPIEDHSRVEDVRLKVTFSIGGQECDDLQDLPKIARETTNLMVHVSKGGWVDTWLDFGRYMTVWRSSGFTKDERWRIFRKLQPLFKRRKLRWRTLVHSHLSLMGAVLSLSSSLFIWASVILLLSKKTSLIPTIAIFVLCVLGVTVAMGTRHTTVVFRHSSEPSPVAHYIKDKLIPVIAGALIGIGGTILALYLRHKYWP